MDSVTRDQIKNLLFGKVCLPALLEQARIDRDEGKILCPKMDRVVNIYSKILTDYPAPVTQGGTQ